MNYENGSFVEIQRKRQRVGFCLSALIKMNNLIPFKWDQIKNDKKKVFSLNILLLILIFINKCLFYLLLMNDFMCSLLHSFIFYFTWFLYAKTGFCMGNVIDFSDLSRYARIIKTTQVHNDNKTF